ncbi:MULTISPECIES: sorbosone dehydrogenase family protein [unclassified Bacillus (in: firmicutes)]|uniref:PQQ-dependent sugar dehydrogenase n=1 Tax=unclassified Bacillus (in: firmicutes) TaxID=185979 RepID=UPI0008F157FE|nr:MULTISPECIES: sorbosone dehydrogenase family protein [unclassified Bacillus (in: firmicutes)]SFB03105.1 Glucose/arabinose dehydrogenase, beta-propeller fold [Bacillus sp. UNCCL13]SFQ88880.1 Glucose/arabinose dehydrogenase, beta-propeller fold [Bacillus sp. cl95]
MNRKFALLMLSVALVTGCSKEGREPKVEQEAETAVLSPQAEAVAMKLSVPWSIEKDDDTIYISERTGSLVELSNGKLVRQDVKFSKTLSTAAEAGFLGFILHPDFSNNQKAYAYYTYEDNGNQYNRLVLLQKETGGGYLETDILLDRIPSGAYHHGGRIKLGPDNKLYITTGDATVPENAQNLQSLAGKILRLNLDGSIPNDNPFAASPVYSYGHRNPQGLVWDDKGNLYESEHGQSAHDEINTIKAGANYGWPQIQGDEKGEGLQNPLYHSGDETWAPSGMAYRDNKLYVATLRGNAVRQFDLAKKTSKVVVSGYGRIRDVWIEGDSLYFVSNNTDGRGNPDENDDKLYRISLKDLP